jgi:hypothetical protein
LYCAIFEAIVRRPMSTLPLNRAPSAMTMRSALRLPFTFDPAVRLDALAGGNRSLDSAEHDHLLGANIRLDHGAIADREGRIANVQVALQGAIETEVFVGAELAIEDTDLPM